MKQEHITEMLFRIESDGQILAVMPYEIGSPKANNVMCYAHIGQHSSCDYYYVLEKTKPASFEQYKNLKDELEDIGYNIQVIHKRNYSKYLTEFYEVTR